MAETRVAPGTQPETVPAETKKKSPVRTLVLFGILLLVIAAYAHDYFIAAPAAKKANDDIQKLVDERNSQGVKGGSLVTSEDIQATLGKQPSKVDSQKDYTVEVYRYWGGMLPQRQYISVLYLGEKEPRRHHVHYLNMMPDKEDYPTETKIPTGAEVDGKADDADKAPGSGEVRTEADGPAPSDAPTDAPPPAESAAPASGDADAASEAPPAAADSNEEADSK